MDKKEELKFRKSKLREFKKEKIKIDELIITTEISIKNLEASLKCR